MERLKVSENGRYFVTADGKPFPWLADTCWTIPQRMKWDDVDYYMKKRRSQGFTVLQIVALDPERDVEMRSPAGEKALIDDNLLKPNEAYFKYLDRVLDKAEEYGFYVLLLPAWGQLIVGDDWMGGTYPKTVNETNARAYGEWLGKRCSSRNNILWCLGGDRQPIHKGIDYRPVWREMAEGLAKGYLGKDLKVTDPKEAWDDLLMTYHSCYEGETGECSSLSYWSEEEPWIRFVMEQSGHGLLPKNYEIIRKDYDRKTIRPVWDGEPAYEAMPTSWPPEDGAYHGSYMVRKRAYWALTSGVFGHTYGHCTVWCTVSERELTPIDACTWTKALDSEASGQMRVLRSFMDDLEPMASVPVYDITADPANENLDEHVSAAYQAQKESLIVYFPKAVTRELKVDSCFKDKALLYGWWFDPRDGKCFGAEGKSARFAVNDGHITVSAPDTGAEDDYVLILQPEEKAAPVTVKEYYELESVGMKKVFEW